MDQTLTKRKPPFLGASSPPPISSPVSLPISAASSSLPFCQMPMLSSLLAFGHRVCSARNAIAPSLILTIPNLIAFIVQLKCHLLQEGFPSMPADKNTDNMDTRRGNSLPTVASTLCLGQNQTQSLFRPHPAVHKSVH